MKNSNTKTAFDDFNPVLVAKKNKGELLLAISLGLLSPFFIGFFIIINLSPYFFTSATNFPFLAIIPNLFITILPEGPGGLYLGIWIFIILSVLIGNFITVLNSYRISHSKRLASITFFSALVFQVIAFMFFSQINMKGSQDSTAILDAEHTYDESITQYATIGYIDIKQQEPYTATPAMSGLPTEKTVFKKLIFTIPIAVSHSGEYEINIAYSQNSEYVSSDDNTKSIKKFLDVGLNIVEVEFFAGDAINWAYEIPTDVPGNLIITIDYLILEKDYYDSLRIDKTLNQERIDSIMKEDRVLEKFVTKKTVTF